MNLHIKRFDTVVPLPKAESKAAGFDFAFRESATIQPGKIALVPLNVAIEIPEGYFLLLTLRSSTPLRRGLMMANAPGIIDPFYCGDKDEIYSQLYSLSDQPVRVEKGEKLVQGILMRYEPVTWHEVESLGNDGRGGYKIKEREHDDGES